MNIPEIVERQKQYFATGATLPIEGRKKALLRLRDGIVRREAKIYEALYADLGKSACEAFMSEIGMVLEEISFLLKNLKKFTAPHKVKPSISQFPAKCYTLASPADALPSGGLHCGGKLRPGQAQRVRARDGKSHQRDRRRAV